MPIFPRYEPPTIYAHLRFPPASDEEGEGAIRASYKFANLFARGRSHFRTNGRRDAKMEEEMERTDEGKMVEDGEGRRGGKGR